MEIEHEAFSAPWSARAYDYELHYNDMAHYFVARPQSADGQPAAPARAPARPHWRRLFQADKRRQVVPLPARPVVGYGGFWLMVDEAHISTIAAHRDWRRRGIGELLLAVMIDRAAEVGASIVTLEVRVSNMPAQLLYRKYDFEVTGRRRHYYSDNGEDALIMSTPTISSAEFQRNMQVRRNNMTAHLAR
ncbi:MAG: ribosomal protein S18-alanine N-acetyltransferase [Chloroflexi bacterium]|nr:ribosomal protein S18-alanine N-acetyltransferase [Chloroflexota bacterium]